MHQSPKAYQRLHVMRYEELYENEAALNELQQVVVDQYRDKKVDMSITTAEANNELHLVVCLAFNYVHDFFVQQDSAGVWEWSLTL